MSSRLTKQTINHRRHRPDEIMKDTPYNPRFIPVGIYIYIALLPIERDEKCFFHAKYHDLISTSHSRCLLCLIKEGEWWCLLRRLCGCQKLFKIEIF